MTDVFQRALHIAHDHPAFAGHFPGRPLLPGVSLLAEVLEVALREPEFAALIGAAPRIASAKFLAPVRPGDDLLLTFSPRGDRLGFEVRRAEQLAASGQFEPSR